MNELLKILNDFTEDEKKEAIKILKGTKPSINFSSVTVEYCIKRDGLNLNLDNLSIAPTLHIPSDFPFPIPSQFLFET